MRTTMNAGRASPKAAQASASTRFINVEQNFANPGQPITSFHVHLSGGWASKPVSLRLHGHTYPVKWINLGWRHGGLQPHAKTPVLNDGNHGATVTLENGTKVPVILGVRTSFFRG